MSAELSIAFALRIQMEIEEKRKREATLISHHSLLSETDQRQLNQLIQHVDRLIEHHQPGIFALFLNTRKATEANKFIRQLEKYRKDLINARTTPAYDSLLKLMLVDLQDSPKDASLAKEAVKLQEFANQTIARMASSGIGDALITKAAQGGDVNNVYRIFSIKSEFFQNKKQATESHKKPGALRNFVERIKLSLKNRFQPKATIIKPSSSFTSIIKKFNSIGTSTQSAINEDLSYPLIPVPPLAPVPEGKREWQPSTSILNLPNPPNQTAVPLQPEIKIGLFFPIVPTHALGEQKQSAPQEMISAKIPLKQ